MLTQSDCGEAGWRLFHAARRLPLVLSHSWGLVRLRWPIHRMSVRKPDTGKNNFLSGYTKSGAGGSITNAVSAIRASVLDFPRVAFQRTGMPSGAELCKH